MAENIEIPKTPMSRTEQYLTKIVKELSGSKEDVEIPKAALSRVEYYLQAIVELLAEVALGETFTADEKKKLASITNPINVQGTCTAEELNSKKDTAQVGDMWFVKNEGDDKSKEYVYTGQDTFDLVGDNSINLTNYVQKDDVASTTGAGLILADDPKQSGLTIGTDGKISIYHPEVTDLGDVSKQYTALTLDRVQPVMSYYGLTNKDTLENTYVKNTQIATTPDVTDGNRKGLVTLGDVFDNGLTTEGGDSNHTLKLTACSEENCKAENKDRLALHPNNIPMFMHNWGLSDKKWCHEIKRTDLYNVNTNVDGCVGTVPKNIVVLAAYCKKNTKKIVTLAPAYSEDSDRILLVAYSLPDGNIIKSTNIGKVVIFYTEVFDAETTSTVSSQSSTPRSEEPSFEPQESPSISQHTPLHTEVETTEVIDPLETEDIQDGEIDG